MRLYWFKGCPGQYYLYDKPRAFSRVPLATCLNRPGQSYLITVNAPGALLPMGWGRAPKTALAEAESQVLVLFPEAKFTRENFT